MTMVERAHEGTPWHAAIYTFLQPTRMRIRDTAGNETLVGFGIGDRVRVMEPSCILLVAHCEVKKEILFEDGSRAVGFQHDIKATRSFDSWETN